MGLFDMTPKPLLMVVADADDDIRDVMPERILIAERPRRVGDRDGSDQRAPTHRRDVINDVVGEQFEQAVESTLSAFVHEMIVEIDQFMDQHVIIGHGISVADLGRGLPLGDWHTATISDLPLYLWRSTVPDQLNVPPRPAEVGRPLAPTSEAVQEGAMLTARRGQGLS
jgi:hypothetical protein